MTRASGARSLRTWRENHQSDCESQSGEHHESSNRANLSAPSFDRLLFHGLGQASRQQAQTLVGVVLHRSQRADRAVDLLAVKAILGLARLWRPLPDARRPGNLRACIFELARADAKALDETAAAEGDHYRLAFDKPGT